MIRKFYLFTIMVIMITLLNGCGKSIKRMLEPGVSKELAEYRKKYISGIEYNLFFNIPEELNSPVEGKLRLSFDQARAQKGIILDFRGGQQNIHSVIVNGEKEDYRYLNEHIIISSKYIIPGRNEIVIDFTSTDIALNRSEEFMYTLFVPDRASTAFPCFDQPDLKGIFSLSLEIPQQWVALANGPQKSVEIKNQRKTVSFQTDKPISTYLFAFTAGKFESISQEKDGRQINIFHRQTDGNKMKNNAEDIFRQHFMALEWLEEYTGIRYPFSKFDLAIIPGFQYSGMEHPGAVWYRDTRLILNDNAPISQKLQRANLIAHETAHMWFGNLVTMKWFNDVWLKEVFAGFMADKMVEPMFPGQDQDLQFMLKHFPSSLKTDRSKGTHPIRQNLENLNKAGSLYGPIIYNKAPIAFRQLEQIAGHESFRKSVREYLSQFAYKNADWDQLVEVFDKNSEHNITSWSQSWVYGKGIPEISYSVNNNKENPLIILRTNNKEEDAAFPSQWLEMIVLTDDEIKKKRLFLAEANVTEPVEASNEIKAVLPNGYGWGYGRFLIPEADREYLLQMLHNFADVELKAAGHLLLYEDFLNGGINPADYFQALLKSINSEDNSVLVSYLLENLNTVFWQFFSPEQRSGFSPLACDVLWKKFLASDPGLKSALLCSYSGIALQKEDYQNIVDLISGKTKLTDYNLNHDDHFTLASNLSIRNYEGAADILNKLKRETENKDKLRHIEYLEDVLSPLAENRLTFFNDLKDIKNRRPEPWAIEGLSFFHHPLYSEKSIEYLQQTLEMLPEIRETGDIFFPARWLEASLAGYNTKQALIITRDFLKNQADLDEDLKLKVLQAADILERSVMINEKYGPDYKPNSSPNLN